MGGTEPLKVKMVPIYPDELVPKFGIRHWIAEACCREDVPHEFTKFHKIHVYFIIHVVIRIVEKVIDVTNV